MFDFDTSFVRWGLLAWTAGFIVAVLVIYFALLKPFEKRAKADLKRSEARRKRLSFLGEVSSLASTCTAIASLTELTDVPSGAVGQIGRLAAQADGDPVLEVALLGVGEAMTTLEIAMHSGDRKNVQAAKLSVATACLAVDREVGNLLTAA
jgi:hypothetical protein